MHGDETLTEVSISHWSLNLPTSYTNHSQSLNKWTKDLNTDLSPQILRLLKAYNNILTCSHFPLDEKNLSSYGKHAHILWCLNVFSNYVLVERIQARKRWGRVTRSLYPDSIRNFFKNLFYKLRFWVRFFFLWGFFFFFGMGKLFFSTCFFNWDITDVLICGI